MIFKPKNLKYCETILEKEWPESFEIYNNFKSYVSSLNIFHNNYLVMNIIKNNINIFMHCYKNKSIWIYTADKKTVQYKNVRQIETLIKL